MADKEKDEVLKVGRRIYYEKATGGVIVDTGERWGAVRETTEDEDYETYEALKKFDRKAVAVKHLEFGESREDFGRASGFMIDPHTEEIRFNLEDAPPIPVTNDQLQQQIADLTSQIATLTNLVKAAAAKK